MSRFSRNILLAFGSCSALALSSTAAHARPAYCQINALNKEVYVSKVIEIGDRVEDLRAFRESSFPEGFEKFVQTNFDPSVGGAQLACYFAPPDSFQRNMEDYERKGVKVYRTEWIPGSAIDQTGPLTGRAVIVAPGTQTASRKKSNAEADAEYAVKMEAYAVKMEAWKRQMRRHEGDMTQYRLDQATFERARAQQAAVAREAQQRYEEARARWARRKAACEAGDHSQCAAEVISR